MGQTPPFIGCCGWSEAQPRYVIDFPTIEIQSTFYQPPAVAVVRRWKALAPPGFRFCLKAWQLITHTPSSPTYRRLKSAIGATEQDLYGSFRPTEQVLLAWERTRDIARILDADVIVFQCPRSFVPTPENTRNLTAFFHQIDRDNRLLAWEPRGEDWDAELIEEICAENQLINCVDPFQSSPVWGETLYWRLHGKTGYRYQYTDHDLAELETMLHARAHRRGFSYVMFNNIYSRQDAQRFGQRLSEGRTPAASGLLSKERRA